MLRKDVLAEKMQDPDFLAAYEEMDPDFLIAEALLDYRLANDMTQKELAKKIGINRSDLSKLESADANPTLKTLKKIAKALERKLEIHFSEQIKCSSDKSEMCNVYHVDFKNKLYADNHKNNKYLEQGVMYQINALWINNDEFFSNSKSTSLMA